MSLILMCSHQESWGDEIDREEGEKDRKTSADGEKVLQQPPRLRTREKEKRTEGTKGKGGTGFMWF